MKGKELLTANDCQIVNLLSRGVGNATTTTRLCQLTGLSVRELQKSIRRLRLAGVVICSKTHKGGGYYLPADMNESRAFVESMDHRGRSVFAAVTSARQQIMNAPAEGQEKMDDA